MPIKHCQKCTEGKNRIAKTYNNHVIAGLSLSLSEWMSIKNSQSPSAYGRLCQSSGIFALYNVGGKRGVMNFIIQPFPEKISQLADRLGRRMLCISKQYHNSPPSKRPKCPVSCNDNNASAPNITASSRYSKPLNFYSVRRASRRPHSTPESRPPPDP